MLEGFLSELLFDDIKMSKEERLAYDRFVDNRRIALSQLNTARLEGINEGEIKTYYNLIKKSRITLEEAADDLNITEEELLESFKKYKLDI